MMKYVVIDVREPGEYANGHIDSAINISPSELLGGTEKLENVPKDANIIVYCRSGNRSQVAKNILKGLGYTNITNGINRRQVQAKYGL